MKSKNYPAIVRLTYLIFYNRENQQKVESLFKRRRAIAEKKLQSMRSDRHYHPVRNLQTNRFVVFTL